MFRVNRLKVGKHYVFRGETLTYQSTTKGLKPKAFIFRTASGERKEICGPILQTELWEEIEK